MGRLNPLMSHGQEAEPDVFLVPACAGAVSNAVRLRHPVLYLRTAQGAWMVLVTAGATPRATRATRNTRTSSLTAMDAPCLMTPASGQHDDTRGAPHTSESRRRLNTATRTGSCIAT